MRTCTAVVGVLATASLTLGQSFVLDGDTAATGLNLDTMPLVTAFGTVTFDGELRDDPSDPDFIALGASGNVFDIDFPDSSASFTFDFDVVSFEFIFGGNVGVFDIRALDIGGNVVDSFFQADTDDGQFAGPVTLSGAGIRSVVWTDPGLSFASIDNVTVSVPTPATGGLLCMAGLVAARRRRA